MVKKINMDWRQAKNRYPNMNPYSDDDFDGLVNSRDCKPLNPAKDGKFSRFMGIVSGGRIGQSAEDYASEKELIEDTRGVREEEKAQKKFQADFERQAYKDDKDAKKQSEEMARAIGEREMAKPAVEAEIKRQLEAKGYLTEEEEEAIRLKVEKQQRYSRSPTGKTLSKMKAEFKEMGQDKGDMVDKFVGGIRKIISPRYPKDASRRAVRKAPKKRFPTRKAKKPTKAQMKARMAMIRKMKKGYQGAPPVRRQRAPTRQAPRRQAPRARVMSVRELYNTPNLRAMLPPRERERIDALPRYIRKEASINFLKMEMKDKQLMNRRQDDQMKRDGRQVRGMQAPQTQSRIEIDLFTGKPKVVTQNIKREAWLN